MTEISWGFFSRRQKVKIPLYLTSFNDFLIFCHKKCDFFQRSKIRKMFYVPTASRPPLGVVLFIASAHVFYYKNSSKSRREKSQEKIQAKKKAGPEAPENSFKKPIQIS